MCGYHVCLMIVNDELKGEEASFATSSTKLEAIELSSETYSESNFI